MGNKPYIREQRLHDLATLLQWDGLLSRKTVKATFGVQDIQASRLIAAFRETYPQLLSWDSKAKLYRASIGQELEEVAGSLTDYLRLTSSRDDHESWVVDARQDLTRIEPQILSDVRSAIQAQAGLEISYCSMTRPQGVTRTIFPHAVAVTARRCHIRAWDADRRDYRDFNLGRIKAARDVGLQAPKLADGHWSRLVRIRLVPHRGLSVSQQRVVRDELFRGASAAILEARAALAHYVIRDLQATLRPEKEIPPEFQLEVSNVSELREWLMPESPG